MVSLPGICVRRFTADDLYACSSLLLLMLGACMPACACSVALCQQKLHVIDTFSTRSSFAKITSAVLLRAFGIIASVTASQQGQ